MKKTKVVAKKKPAAKQGSARAQALKPKAKAPMLALVPSGDTQTKKHVKKASDLIERVKMLAVRNRDTLEGATALLGHVTQEAKDIEERRVFFVKPIKEHAKAIDQFFKTLSDPLDRASQELRRKILVYREHEQSRVLKEQAERDAQAQAESERAEALREAGDEKAAAEAEASAMEIATTSVEAAPDQTINVGAARVTARSVWKFEVVDIASVPNEYFVLDEKMIRRAVMSGLRSIPGVRIYEEEQLAVSSAQEFDHSTTTFGREDTA